MGPTATGGTPFAPRCPSPWLVVGRPFVVPAALGCSFMSPVSGTPGALVRVAGAPSVAIPPSGSAGARARVQGSGSARVRISATARAAPIVGGSPGTE